MIKTLTVKKSFLIILAYWQSVCMHNRLWVGILVKPSSSFLSEVRYLFPFTFSNKLGHFFSSWKIRIGDSNHATRTDNLNSLELNILHFFVHPLYDKVASYYDVGILQTNPIPFSKAIRYQSWTIDIFTEESECNEISHNIDQGYPYYFSWRAKFFKPFSYM